MSRLAVIPGDTLHHDHSTLTSENTTYFLAETRGLCTHHAYHKHKLVFFLASMRHHRDELISQGHDVIYKALEQTDGRSYEDVLADVIDKHGFDAVHTYKAKDNFFGAVRKACDRQGASLTEHPNPNFLTSQQTFQSFLDGHDYYHASFYQWQRQRLDILVNDDGTPINGKWSFDTDNREALDDTDNLPGLPRTEATEHVEDVANLINQRFPDHIGRTESFWLPVTREESQRWLDAFFEDRFEHFGPYQDAMNEDEAFAYHSVISPMLNNGLLDPADVVRQAVDHYEENNTRYSSVEGFIRQIIGWREFIKGVYDNESLSDCNAFGHTRSLSEAWYDGTTGLLPVDDVIDQVKEYGYAHHIQRLMVLSNTMLLCEVDPDEVYDWFMECFVDSADWVMVPNVYDMGQYATGGLFATKPYVSSSNYVEKMSDYSTGEWCDDWDALYWSFLDKHRDVFEDNRRMSLILSLLDKKDDEERKELREHGDSVRDRLTK